MHRKQVNERSPLRVLEQSIHGGLGRGNVGVVVARTGVGKTAFLVCVALDDLMRGQKVLHVSLEQPVDKTRSYYDEIFKDLAHSQQLEDVWKVQLELERNRRIHCYNDDTFSSAKLREAVGFMREQAEFVPSAIIIDGLDFGKASSEMLTELRELARECEAELWMSATTSRESERNPRGVPEPVASLENAVDVILTMGYEGSAVHVGLLKDHENPQVSELKLALDPTTLLLVRE